MGDPLGIGPEIICKALSNRRLRGLAGYRIFGSQAALHTAAKLDGLGEFWHSGDGSAPGDVVLIDDGSLDARTLSTRPPGPTKEGGAASFRWVEQAIEAVKRGEAHAIATAPISKTSWTLAGHTQFPGHTELLADRFKAKRSGMLFVGPHLKVILATIHIPLMQVASQLTTQRILETIELAHEACLSLRGTSILPGSNDPRSTNHGQDVRATHPRIAVCGLNPHAGEGGILGTEDAGIIAPAIAQARAKSIDAHGPLPADTLFKQAAAQPIGKGAYDCVVAMYHDQGLIPVKLIDGELAVNVTVGLPTIRTSPAHGTAFDIAGKGIASAASMAAALELAIRMATRENRPA
jgi:4-hydroxythreonine-4-phosphate dehydrogenase